MNQLNQSPCCNWPLCSVKDSPKSDLLLWKLVAVSRPWLWEHPRHLLKHPNHFQLIISFWFPLDAVKLHHYPKTANTSYNCARTPGVSATTAVPFRLTWRRSCRWSGAQCLGRTDRTARLSQGLCFRRFASAGQYDILMRFSSKPSCWCECR